MWHFPQYFFGDTPSKTNNDRLLYFQDLLSKYKGKKISAHMRYDGKKQVFQGELMEVGRDFFVLNDERIGENIILFIINLDYVLLLKAKK